MKRLAMMFIFATALVTTAAPAYAHGPEMMLGSTAAGSGALGLAYDFTDPIVVTPELTLGSMTLYSSIFPGIEWLQEDDPADMLHVLTVGTPFSMQIVAIDPGASVMVGGTTLSAAGQSAFVATTTNVTGDHFHPQWQVLLPEGVMGSYSVSFRLTTTSHSYVQSSVYSLMITNLVSPTQTPTAAVTPTAPPTPSPTDTAVPEPTPTGTAVPSPTDTNTAVATQTPTPSATRTMSSTASASPTVIATPTASRIAGDANCDGSLTVADLSAVVLFLSTESPDSSTCGLDANGDGLVDERDLSTIQEALFAGARP